MKLGTVVKSQKTSTLIGKFVDAKLTQNNFRMILDEILDSTRKKVKTKIQVKVEKVIIEKVNGQKVICLLNNLYSVTWEETVAFYLEYWWNKLIRRLK